MTRNELMELDTAQVRFFDENSENYLSGILHNGEVICGCCGCVIPIDEIFEFYDFAVADNPALVKRCPKPILVYENWVDLCEAISGDADDLDENCFRD